ncbi:PREDICTED: protein-glutamate O-methyltransferase [Drosophila arizonae]|uniref:Sugar phosphate phosphatase n=1 Tax=Drosophila arizonae TaxID=7263 RepID=A0ABM1NZ11_DROAR|nr:PREDICTED: protein-glutamate O-methyltransferase [Drosophila arizonae]
MTPSFSSSMGADLLDVTTPRHSLLSGRFKQSFAYIALQTRMPGIMSQIIMTLFSNKARLQQIHGSEVDKDFHIIIESIERLKRELLRDRNFQLFHGNEPDKAEWNAFISELPRPKRSFFRASWLHSECYLYRRISSFFENSKCLKDFDYFQDLKQEDLIVSNKAISCLTLATRGLMKDFKSFSRLMRINLWSNHFEIQLSSFIFESPQDHSNIDVLAQVADLDRRVLVDESQMVWDCLLKAKGEHIIVDYICDNGGFELFTDLLFIEYLVDQELATQVRMHVKAIPWYISDVMKHDIEWTIKYLKDSKEEHVSLLGKKLESLMESERIVIAPISHFWTGPQSYFVMVDSNFELYRMLSQAQLAIFKGDLNYRKLLGDYIWDSTEEFITCLRGFRPTNMCAMRNVKCEVICGLPEGTADHLMRTDPTWMISGYYGVIQYTDSLKCKCEAQLSLCSLHSKII